MFVKNESVSRWYSGIQYGLSDFGSGHGAVLQPFDALIANTNDISTRMGQKEDADASLAESGEKDLTVYGSYLSFQRSVMNSKTR